MSTDCSGPGANVHFEANVWESNSAFSAGFVASEPSARFRCGTDVTDALLFRSSRLIFHHGFDDLGNFESFCRNLWWYAVYSRAKTSLALPAAAGNKSVPNASHFSFTASSTDVVIQGAILQ